MNPRKESSIPNGPEHILNALTHDARYDGRTKETYRDITIELNVSETAEGSATVTAGDCKVMAGVKLSIGTPFPDRPNEGVLMVGCELLPMAHKSIESGPPSIDAIEISRVIDRGIRESQAIDVKQLCIEEGQKVWIVSVDIVPINHDGNIIDIGALAAIAALKATKFPEVVDGVIDYHKLSSKKIKIEKIPIPTTINKIGKEIFVDATKVEEDNIESRITVTTLEDGKICSLQKGGNGTFTIEELDKAFDLAIKKGKELRTFL
jgi:exosome complex component RRP42